MARLDRKIWMNYVSPLILKESRSCLLFSIFSDNCHSFLTKNALQLTCGQTLEVSARKPNEEWLGRKIVPELQQKPNAAISRRFWNARALQQKVQLCTNYVKVSKMPLVIAKLQNVGGRFGKSFVLKCVRNHLLTYHRYRRLNTHMLPRKYTLYTYTWAVVI